MRIPLFDRMLRTGNLGFWMLSLALVCMACEPAADSTESTPPTNTNSALPPSKATPVASQEDKEACKNAVESLLKIAKSGKNADAAPLLVYRGEDKKREWKAVCDYKLEDDQLYVDKTMAKLQVIRSGLEKHTFREFLTEKEHEGVWYVWVTDMVYDDGSKDEKAFAFLKLDGRYALGDID